MSRFTVTTLLISIGAGLLVDLSLLAAMGVYCIVQAINIQLEAITRK